MATIELYAYWGKWLPFSLNNEELVKLRAYLRCGSEQSITLGGHTFRVYMGSLWFATGGTPSKYYLEMTLQEIITVIDETLR